MGRQKKRIIAVETIYPDTQRNQDGKYLTNFVAYEDNAVNAFKENSKRDIWNEKASPDVVKKLITDREKNLKKSTFFHNEEIGIDEALTLSEKVKTTDPYIFKVRDMENPAWPKEVFGTQKEALAYIEKKIKNKFVHLIYNGINEVVEYDVNELANIIARMSENTTPIEIAQVTRGEDEYWYEIEIFKNCLKI